MNHQIDISLPQLNGDALPGVKRDILKPLFHYEVENSLPLHPESCRHGAIEEARDFGHVVLCNASPRLLKKYQIVFLVEPNGGFLCAIRLDLVMILLASDSPLLQVF